jgi:hypothetical protein
VRRRVKYQTQLWARLRYGCETRSAQKRCNPCPRYDLLPMSPGRTPNSAGGGGGIRTPETLSSLTVFKTAGFNRSPTPPFTIVTQWSHEFGNGNTI